VSPFPLNDLEDDMCMLLLLLCTDVGTRRAPIWIMRLGAPLNTAADKKGRGPCSRDLGLFVVCPGPVPPAAPGIGPGLS
jgi:hypothetical protein